MIKKKIINVMQLDNQGLDIVESKSTIESELKLFLRKKIVGPKFLELTKL